MTELTPYFAGGFYNLAVCLNANGQPEPALNAFRKVLEITPEHPGALLNAGKCSMAMEKLDDAVDFFSAVIQQDSESQDGYLCRGYLCRGYLCGYLCRGIARFHNGQYDEACTDFVQIKEQEPSFWMACYYHGCSLMQLGDAASATRWLEQAESLHPGLTEAKEMRFLSLIQLERFGDALELADQLAAADPSVRQRFSEQLDVARKAVMIPVVEQLN